MDVGSQAVPALLSLGLPRDRVAYTSNRFKFMRCVLPHYRNGTPSPVERLKGERREGEDTDGIELSPSPSSDRAYPRGFNLKPSSSGLPFS